MRYDLLPHHTDIHLNPTVSAKITETRVSDLIPIEEEDDDCIVENKLVCSVNDEDEATEEEEEEEEDKETEDRAVVPCRKKCKIEESFPIPSNKPKMTRSGRRSIPPTSLPPAPTTSNKNSKRTSKKSDSSLPNSKSASNQSSFQFVSDPSFAMSASSLPLLGLSPVVLRKNGEKRKMFSSPAAAAAVAAAAINNAKQYQRTKQTHGANHAKKTDGGGTRKRARARKKEPMSPCQTCGKVFFSRFNMLRHVENVHLGVLPYLCRLCGKRFAQKNGMQKHMVTNHSSGKKRRQWKGNVKEEEEEEESEPGELHAVMSIEGEQFEDD